MASNSPCVSNQASVAPAVEVLFVSFRVVLTKNTSSFVCFEKEQVESTAAAYVSLFVGSFCDADKPCAG